MSQIVLIAAAPILSRLYLPSEFGILAAFVAIGGFAQVFATGRYEIAILLPKDDDDARDLVYLVFGVAAAVSVAILVVVLVVDDWIARTISTPDLKPWLLVLPISVFIAGVYQGLNYWLNRRRQYRTLAVNRIVRSFATVASMVALGLAGWTAGGLILGTVVGQALALIVLGRLWHRDRSYEARTRSREGISSAARRYKNFALFSVPADAVNTVSQQMPVLLLGGFFTPAIVGFYNLTQRVLQGPETLIASAVGDVFRERAGRDMVAHGNCRRLWRSVFLALTAIAVPVFALVAWLAPSAFGFAFGEQWKEAGEYARLLTPFFMLAFLGSTLGRTMYIAEKQRQDLVWQLVLLMSVTAAMIVGGRAGSARLAIGLFSAAYSGMYLVYLWMSYRYSGGSKARPGSGEDGDGPLTAGSRN